MLSKAGSASHSGKPLLKSEILEYLLEPYLQHKVIAIAVSGGGDSMALLSLMHGLGCLQMRSPKLIAFTVDHGLRAESAEEARMVAHYCDEFSIDHTVLTWVQDGATNSSANAAREARYQLLAQAAAASGADCVLLAHTMEDQAETLVMRGERGSDAVTEGEGMAGMASGFVYHLADGTDVRFERPLLIARREALREHLRYEGLAWADDPTNDNLGYERPRIRAGLAGEDHDRIPELARSAMKNAHNRQKNSLKVAALFDAALSIECGIYSISNSALRSVEPVIATRALRCIIGCAGGGNYLPAVDRITPFLARLEEPTSNQNSSSDPSSNLSSNFREARTTIGNCVVSQSNEGITMWREMRNLNLLKPVPNEWVEWDNRFRLIVERSDLTVAVLGQKGLLHLEAIGGEKLKLRPRAALFSEPGLWQDGKLLSAPTLDLGEAIDCSIERICGPLWRFVGDFDAPIAEVLEQKLAGR